MRISKDIWYSAIGVGLFTLIYSLIMTSTGLWMGAGAFISVSLFFGIGTPHEKVGNLLVSYALGIGWGCLAFWLLQFPAINGLVPSAIMFGVLTFLAIFLQGTILTYAFVPAWFIAWGTFMLIATNMTITDWPLFVGELFLAFVLGIVVIAYGSKLFNHSMDWLFFREKS